MVCPTCGARPGEACTSFDMLGPGKPGPSYTLTEPHALRDVADVYWRAVELRLALVAT